MTKATESPTDIPADTITDEIAPDETVIEAPPGLGKRVFQPQTLLGFLLAGVAS